LGEFWQGQKIAKFGDITIIRNISMMRMILLIGNILTLKNYKIFFVLVKVNTLID